MWFRATDGLRGSYRTSDVSIGTWVLGGIAVVHDFDVLVLPFESHVRCDRGKEQRHGFEDALFPAQIREARQI